jgi:hypothetical protein
MPSPYQSFFLHPTSPQHLHYEVLRARFVDGLSHADIAQRFSISPFTVGSLVRDFKHDLENDIPVEFFLKKSPGPKTDRKKSRVRDHILELRDHGYASTDIQRALDHHGLHVSLSLIDQVLREAARPRLGKRDRRTQERIAREIASGAIPGFDPEPAAVPERAAVADVRTLRLDDGQTHFSRVAGVFLFAPFLVRAGLDALVARAGMSASSMIPATSAVLSLLALKLLDKERKSHIADWNFDAALGWFAGLNILPKVTAATDYAYRLVDDAPSRLLAEWVRAVYPVLCPDGARTFAMDFHAIAHRGDDTGLEKHYVPMRGKATTSVLTCFARAVDTPFLCYADADIIRVEQHSLPIRFVEYWHDLTGMQPGWLYLDSRVTTYPILDQLRARNINFITIRRRGTRLIRDIAARPASEWTTAVIDTPQRRQQRIRYLDQAVRLPNYSGSCRQIVVDFQRPTPTLFLTNNTTATGRDIVTRYIGRNTIENDLGINVNFFHMDCLASEVRLNVHADVVMTVLANGCYRWLSQQLKGCERMEPKQLYRKFVETAGHVTVRDEEIVVKFERRSHNPIIAQARLDQEAVTIPWLQNKRLRFEFS